MAPPIHAFIGCFLHAPDQGLNWQPWCIMMFHLTYLARASDTILLHREGSALAYNPQQVKSKDSLCPSPTLLQSTS